VIDFDLFPVNNMLCLRGSCRSGLDRKTCCYSKSVTYNNLWP